LIHGDIVEERAVKPTRIQLSRRKGWRMPANTVKVDRTTKWGNPFVIGVDGTREECVELFARMLRQWDRPGHAYVTMAKANLEELRGKNLACWCSLPEEGERDLCHAATLLEAANREMPGKNR
jgi:hypothetical protein